MVEEKITDEYPWYSIVPAESHLEQGDFIKDCPFLELRNVPLKGQNVDFGCVYYDVIVMTQSCDLAASKVDLVIVCPFDNLKNIDKEFQTPRNKNKLGQGAFPARHLLNKVSDEGDYLVVDFKNTFAVPLAVIKKIALARGDRKRLLPPYREHLSQSFARFFMRVGLPRGLPDFTKPIE